MRYLVEYPQEGCVYVSEQQTLLDASLAAGVPLFHVCGGHARCSTCRVLVLEGADRLSAPNERERALKQQMRFPPQVRLACQTYVTGGPVRVSRILKDETDIGLYVGPFAGESTQQIGEEQEMALFFLDIRNFTPFIEKQLAFDVIHIIRKLFTGIGQIIEDHGGRIIETAGDGLYAAFWASGDKVSAVRSAVQSSFAILEELEQLNETYFTVHFNHRIEVGIGLHVGRVVKGDIRLGGENHLIVMGYPVNVAARLQAQTRRLNNSFIVSGEVFSLLAPPPQTATATVDLKGVTGVCQVYLLGRAYKGDGG